MFIDDGVGMKYIHCCTMTKSEKKDVFQISCLLIYRIGTCFILRFLRGTYMIMEFLTGSRNVTPMCGSQLSCIASLPVL